MMNHALVRKDGQWVSFGLHVSSPQWSDVFRTLKRAFGEDNVRYIWWGADTPPLDGHQIAQRLQAEVIYANAAQEQWDRGQLKEAADDDGRLSLSQAINILSAV